MRKGLVLSSIIDVARTASAVGSTLFPRLSSAASSVKEMYVSLSDVSIPSVTRSWFKSLVNSKMSMILLSIPSSASPPVRSNCVVVLMGWSRIVMAVTLIVSYTTVSVNVRERTLVFRSIEKLVSSGLVLSSVKFLARYAIV